MGKRDKPPKPEVVGPCTAIRRFDPSVTVAELRAMMPDDRWEFARECVEELPDTELEARR